MLKNEKLKRVISVFFSFFFAVCFTLTIASSLLIVTGCQGSSSNEQQKVSGSFFNNEQKELLSLTLEVARTDYQRELGLMYRNELAENRGMIFIYPSAKPRSFWMKNTLIPLDILFLDSELKVVAIAENAAPLTLDSRSSGGLNAQYVIEIQGGLSAKKGISVGTLFVPASQLPTGEDGV